MRVNELHQTRKGLLARLSVALNEVRAEREIAIGQLREVELTQLPERLGQEIHVDPIVAAEELWAHRRDFPAVAGARQPIEEGEGAHVLRKGLEQVARLDEHVHGAV